MKRPLQNIVAVAGADLLSRLLGFVANAYLARRLGTSAFGVMSIGFSVLGYVVLFSSPGLHVLGIREVAASSDRKDSLVWSINSLRMALAVIFVLVAVCIAWLFIQPIETRVTTIVFALSAIPLAFSLDWYFQAKERLVESSGSKVVVALVYLVFVLLLVSREGDVVWTAIAFLAANILSALWLLTLFRRTGGKVSVGWEIGAWHGLLRQSMPLGISGFLAQTIMNFPVLLVGALISSHDAGLFNAAMKLVFAVMIVDRVFYAMFFPVISRHFTLGQEKFLSSSALALRILLAVAIPIVVECLVAAPQIVHLVYGQSFTDSALLFQVLLLYFLFSVVNTVFMCVMIAENRESEFTRIMAVATGILVLACIGFSLAFGVLGTAASLALGEGTMTLILAMKEGRRVFPRLTRLVAPAFTAGMVMFGIMVQLHSVSHSLALGAGVIAFYVVLIILRGISKDEFLFLRERFV
jgi:O-antigen/teichoic acid export membrane protein